MDFKFYETIPVRYGDLDPQGHVNNARFLSYIEQSRFAYLINLGLFDGKSFLDLGWIVADIHIRYLAPIFMGQVVRVGTRTGRLGNKSLTFISLIEDQTTGQALAEAETVMVSFDYHAHTSVLIPPAWREKIAAFEGIAAYTEAGSPRKE